MSSPIDKAISTLCSDENFLNDAKESIKDILSDGKIDISDIPELILLVVNTYNNRGDISLTYNELPDLIHGVTQHFLDQENLIPEDKKDDFEKIMKAAIKLVLVQPKIKNCCKKTFGCLPCFKC